MTHATEFHSFPAGSRQTSAGSGSFRLSHFRR